MNGPEDSDFEKPAPVGRDPLTEGWKPVPDKGDQDKGGDQ